MWTRSARAGALAALAVVAFPVPAGAQSLVERLQEAAKATSTAATTTTAPTETAPTATAPAATTPAPAATDPNATAAPATTTPGPPAAEQPPAGVSNQPIDAAAKEDRGSAAVPAVLVALAVVAVLLLIGALAWAIARWFSWDPRWMQRWRHAGREAAYRASGVWADFADWVRLGR